MEQRIFIATLLLCVSRPIFGDEPYLFRTSAPVHEPDVTFSQLMREQSYLNGVEFATAGGDMQLTLLKDQVANGVMCMDGSPAGFYFAASKNQSTATKWQIYFQGGSWCYSEYDCWGRTKTPLGSSKFWSQTSSIGGIMSSDCDTNPDFCTWNRVHIGYVKIANVILPTQNRAQASISHYLISSYTEYCDGSSYSGDRSDPILVKGEKIYFRGFRILNAVLNALMARGLSAATDVLLTGCSAGGLATFLHSVDTKSPALVNFKALAFSGFFLKHNNVKDKPVYPEQMKAIFELSNATSSIPANCLNNKTSSDAWQCMFAPEIYSTLSSPFFIINSALDAWQTRCIIAGELAPKNSTDNGHCGAVAGWTKCSAILDVCTTKQMKTLISYEHEFVNTLEDIETYSKDGNGGFISSCHTHCAAQTSAYNSVKKQCQNGGNLRQQLQQKKINGRHAFTMITSRMIAIRHVNPIATQFHPELVLVVMLAL
eukprot:gene4997-6947_t